MTASKGQAFADPESFALDAIDVADPELYATDTQGRFFERLRREAPVHFCAESDFGPYWSVTRHADIVAVEKDPETYSSARGVVVGDPDPRFSVDGGFITMDGARHQAHRKAVQPIVSPRHLKRLEPLIRERAVEILDALPVGESFDWVDRVSIELTTAMLATLFDFPYEDRRRLTFWSDMATSSAEMVGSDRATRDERQSALRECRDVFLELARARQAAPASPSNAGFDFVTALVNDPATRDMPPREFLGTVLLLIIGGNDTTRNSISGGVVALNEHPDEWRELRARPAAIPNMVSEIIRWQTPLAHMRRVATRDAELVGKKIKAGQKVVLWYVSANRDEAVFDAPDAFRIERPNARQHLSFGIGVHFCMGSRLAELQLRVLWEEILLRFREVELVGAPERVRSNFVRGYARLPVRVHRR